MNRLPILRFLCRCLGSSGPDAKQSLQAEISSPLFPWELVVELAGQYYLTPALYCALRGKGLLHLVPADLRDYLDTIHSLNQQRNRRLVEQAYEVAGILNRLEIEPIAMKGVGNVLAGVYPDAGLRMAGDIDLLVPAARLEDARRALTTQGYELYLSEEFYHHLAPLQLKGRIGVVELHGCAPQQEHRRFLSTEDITASSRVYQRGGARIRVASASFRVIIAVSHAYLHHRAALQATLPLRDLYDVFFHLSGNDRWSAAASTSGIGAPHDRADWDFIAHFFDRAGHARSLRQVLYLIERLFGLPSPGGLSLGTHSPWFWYACLFRVRYPRTVELAIREAASIGELLADSAEGQRKRRNLSKPKWYIHHFKSLANARKRSPKL